MPQRPWVLGAAGVSSAMGALFLLAASHLVDSPLRGSRIATAAWADLDGALVFSVNGSFHAPRCAGASAGLAAGAARRVVVAFGESLNGSLQSLSLARALPRAARLGSVLATGGGGGAEARRRDGAGATSSSSSSIEPRVSRAATVFFGPSANGSFQLAGRAGVCCRRADGAEVGGGVLVAKAAERVPAVVRAGAGPPAGAAPCTTWMIPS